MFKEGMPPLDELDQYRDTLPPPPPEGREGGEEKESPFESMGDSISVVRIKKEMGLEKEGGFDINGDKKLLAPDGSYGAVIDGIGPSKVADAMSGIVQSEISKALGSEGPILNKSAEEAKSSTIQALEAANTGIQKEKDRALKLLKYGNEVVRPGGGASVSMINFCENGKKAVIGQIGDSEILRVRDGNIERITPKDSAEDFLERGGYIDGNGNINIKKLEERQEQLDKSRDDPDELRNINNFLFEAKLKLDKKTRNLKLEREQRKKEEELKRKKEKKQEMIDRLESGKGPIVLEKAATYTKLKDVLIFKDEEKPLILQDEKDRQQLITELSFVKARKGISEDNYQRNLNRIKKAELREGREESETAQDVNLSVREFRGIVTKALNGSESPKYQVFDTDVEEGDEFILLTKGVDLPKEKILSLSESAGNARELSKSLVGESRMQMLDEDNKEALFTDATAVVIKSKKAEEQPEAVAA